MKPDRVRGHLEMLLLATLADGPAHGYALSAELRRRTDGRLTVIEGSLYPALHRLEAAGFVASEMETVDGRRRRRYELTADGKDALEDEIDSWRDLRSCIDDVLGDLA